MTERELYLEIGEWSVFATHHAPDADRRRVGVLLIPPFGWEEIASHRSRREWALHLAENGYDVMRVDLPGTGDSDGDLLHPNRWQSWRDAVAGAALWLRAEANAERISLIGIGLGGFLALDGVASGAADEAVVWATPATGKRYLREFQAFAALEQKRIPEAGGSLPYERSGIAAGGFVIDDGLAAAIEDVVIGQMALAVGSRVLLLDRDGTGLAGRVADELARGGADVETARGVGYADMTAAPHDAKVPRRVFAVVDAWLERGRPTSDDRPTTPAPRSASELVGSGLRESPVVIDRPRGRLRGIVATPASGEHAPLTIVFLNAGAVRRIGPHRLWLEAARRWAGQGVASLRLDTEGIGDAGGDGDVYADVARLHDGHLVDHVIATLDALVARGLPDRFVLVGLCSGGYWGFQTALIDPRVAAVAMVNPRVLYWHDLLHAFRSAPLSGALVQPARWRRLLRGGTSMRQIARSFSSARLRRRHRMSRSESSPLEWQARNVAEGFTSLSVRGQSAHFVFSDGEVLHDELSRAGLLSQPDSWPNVFYTSIHGRDHTLNPIWMHAPAHRALDEVISHELARAAAEPGPGEPGGPGARRSADSLTRIPRVVPSPTETTKPPNLQGFREAAGLGLEPRLPDPESGVLPLDDPAAPRNCSPIPKAILSIVMADVGVELVTLGALPRRVWLDLTERDPAAFGAITAGLIYRDKDRHLALRRPDGRFAAAIGLTVVTIEVVGYEPFDVVGVGSLIVRREHRGSGLGQRLLAAAREVIGEMGPERAMLFCEPGAIAVNQRRGYIPIEGPVLVDQPGERIVMPIPAMWRPIRPCAWPSGPVNVHGLPF